MVKSCAQHWLRLLLDGHHRARKLGRYFETWRSVEKEAQQVMV